MATVELSLSGRSPSSLVGALSLDDLLRPVRGEGSSVYASLLHASVALEATYDAFTTVLSAYLTSVPEPSRPRVPCTAVQTARGSLRHGDVDAWKLSSLLSHGLLSTSTPGWNILYSVLEGGPGDEVHTTTLAGALLAAGVNPSLPCPGGVSPLHLLCGEKYASVNSDELLLQLVARVGANVRDASGATPLLDACRYSGVEVVSLLLAAGADVNAMDGGGESALDRVLRSAGSATPSRFIKKIDALMHAGFNALTMGDSGPAVVAIMGTLARLMSSSAAMDNMPAKSAARVRALYAQLEPVAMPYMPTGGGAAAGDDHDGMMMED